MKKIKKGKTIALLAVSTTLLVAAVVVDSLTLGTFANSIDKVFVKKDTDLISKTEATDNAKKVAEAISDEGEVLLKNDGALPLSNTSKINVLGYRSENIIWGGSGSGGSSYAGLRVDLDTAFANVGITVNPALSAAYKKVEISGQTGFSASFANDERAANAELATTYGQTFFYQGDLAFDKLADYSDTALIVLSRAGGEGSDLPTDLSKEANFNAVDHDKSYLELTEAEKSLVAESKATFKKVIVVINSSNAMELGFLGDTGSKDTTGDIDAAVWIGGPGNFGLNSLAKIITGEVNPSGKLVDTYPYEVEANPALNNFGSFTYTNSNQCFTNYDSHSAYFIDYQEGIYVGYKYYETADSFTYTTFDGASRVNQSYKDTIQYPFGYGLSYTSFSYEVTSSKADDSAINRNDELSIKVKVTNTGSVKGKESVQLYYGAPYNSSSKIQKSKTNLIGFAKTDELEPGASQTLEVKANVEDMASYDDLKYYSSTGSYVLENGQYNLSIRSDAHDVIKSYNYNLDKTVVYNDSSSKSQDNCEYVGKRSSDKELAVNRFDEARGTDFTYATRENQFATSRPSDKEATSAELAAFNSAMDLGDYEVSTDVAPFWGQTLETPLSLFDMKGADYDSSDWDSFLSQLTLTDLDAILANNGWGSAAISAIAKPQTYDMDGPAGISYVFDAFMGTVTYETVSYPASVVLASTWNATLATAYGDSVSKEGQAWNVSGWYAPGANIHRTQFDGRNFEYYSEDGYLSGVFLTNSVTAAQNNGMYAYMKHFVLNETETNRHYGLCTWFSEQSLRETYMKPFEMAVKSGNATALMSSYNNLGTTWAGDDKALLTDTLRGEWGFKGMVLTDNLEDHGFMNIQKAILNGGTSLLCNGLFAKQGIDDLKKTATGQKYLKEAAHQYMYTVSNSFVPGLKIVQSTWKVIDVTVSCIVYGLALAGLGWGISRLIKSKKQEEQGKE